MMTHMCETISKACKFEFDKYTKIIISGKSLNGLFCTLANCVRKHERKA